MGASFFCKGMQHVGVIVNEMFSFVWPKFSDKNYLKTWSFQIIITFGDLKK